MSHNLRINLPCSRLFHLSEGHSIPEATLSKEKALSTLDFSMSFATRSPALFSSKHVFSFFFVLLLKEALLVALQIPHHIKLQVSFDLPSPIHAHLNSVSVSDVSLFLSLECFLCSGFIRNILFIHDGLLSITLLDFLLIGTDPS